LFTLFWETNEWKTYYYTAIWLWTIVINSINVGYILFAYIHKHYFFSFVLGTLLYGENRSEVDSPYDGCSRNGQVKSKILNSAFKGYQLLSIMVIFISSEIRMMRECIWIYCSREFQIFSEYQGMILLVFFAFVGFIYLF
jgi:hypothetical protein